MAVYKIGALVETTAEFTDPATGAFIDPATVVFKVKPPATAVVVKTYGVDPEVLKDSQGKYRANIDANAPGRWHYRWQSTGAGQAAEETSFTIKETRVQ